MAETDDRGTQALCCISSIGDTTCASTGQPISSSTFNFPSLPNFLQGSRNKLRTPTEAKISSSHPAAAIPSMVFDIPHDAVANLEAPNKYVKEKALTMPSDLTELAMGRGSQGLLPWRFASGWDFGFVSTQDRVFAYGGYSPTWLVII